MCFIGCKYGDIDFTVSSTNIPDFSNSAAVMIFDNTHLPINGTPPAETLEISYHYKLTVSKNNHSIIILYYLGGIWLLLTVILGLIIYRLNYLYYKIKEQYQ